MVHHYHNLLGGTSDLFTYYVIGAVLLLWLKTCGCKSYFKAIILRSVYIFLIKPSARPSYCNCCNDWAQNFSSSFTLEQRARIARRSPTCSFVKNYICL